MKKGDSLRESKGGPLLSLEIMINELVEGFGDVLRSELSLESLLKLCNLGEKLYGEAFASGLTGELMIVWAVVV